MEQLLVQTLLSGNWCPSRVSIGTTSVFTMHKITRFCNHITTVVRSCRFALCNICRIRSFLTKDVTQLLVQALVISHMDHCNSLLVGLPACGTKPLQRIQNTAARLVYNLSKFSHVTPSSVTSTDFLLRPASDSRHWCWPSRTSTELQPSTSKHWSDHSPQQEHRSSTSTGWLLTPSLRANKAHSAKLQLFSVLAPKWWNGIPTNVWRVESLSNFRKRPKTHLFRLPPNPFPKIKKNLKNVCTCMFIS